jgi:hypothetical protein
MTTAELFRHFAKNAWLASKIKSHFSETQLWGFVERDEKGRWVATSKAGAFLRGEIRVFRAVWPKVDELPAWCADEELIYLWEVWGEKPDAMRAELPLDSSRSYNA